MSAILGSLRSFLMAMPFLRSFTDAMLAFINTQKVWGWDHKLIIPETLKQEIREVSHLTESWKGRKFSERVPVRTLHSDSSDWGWGGLDTTTGQFFQEYWRQDKVLTRDQVFLTGP